MIIPKYYTINDEKKEIKIGDYVKVLITGASSQVLQGDAISINNLQNLCIDNNSY